jgi:hypothetical protein
MPKLNYHSYPAETRCLEDMLTPGFIDEVSGCLGHDWYRANVPINAQDLTINITFEFNHHDEEK